MTLEKRICKHCNGEGYIEVNRGDERFSLHLRLWSVVLVALTIIGYTIHETIHHHNFPWWVTVVFIICVGLITGTIDKIRDLASPSVQHLERGNISYLLSNLITRELGSYQGTLFCELLILIRDQHLKDSVVAEDITHD